jgi:mannitol/fructose-specific phosphotransferase system IIA component (Ntr-type)
MRITDLLTIETTLPAVTTRRRDDVLMEIAGRIASHHPAIPSARLASALFKREDLMTTALADGVAIPHARMPGLAHPVAAFARSAQGIDWSAQDGGLTHVIFVLVVPDEAGSPHLRLLAAASRLLHDAGCRGRIMQAADDALLPTLRAEEDRVAPSVRVMRPIALAAV